MKIRLTSKQADKLFELGVPKKVATRMSSYINSYEEYHYYYFTVTDLLEILPKEIKDERLCRDTAFLNFYALGEVWTASYEFLSFDFEFMSRESQELIDALYELLLWTIEAGYLKFE